MTRGDQGTKDLALAFTVAHPARRSATRDLRGLAEEDRGDNTPHGWSDLLR